MFLLIIGGAGSGKSEYAEERCLALSTEKMIYLATMEVRDAESVMRVNRHRAMRSGKGFVTIECPVALDKAAVSPESTVLLECMSNLVANEMFSENGFFALGEKEAQSDSALVAAILTAIQRLKETSQHLIVVTNQVFSDGVTYDSSTERYRACLAKVNNAMAQMADEVTEVVCGIPIRIGEKGFVH